MEVPLDCIRQDAIEQYLGKKREFITRHLLLKGHLPTTLRLTKDDEYFISAEDCFDECLFAAIFQESRNNSENFIYAVELKDIDDF